MLREFVALPTSGDDGTKWPVHFEGMDLVLCCSEG
jgi:hypothetical protein